jgi:hypothetical protein
MVLSSPARLPPAAKKHAQERKPTQVMRPKGVLNWVQSPARMPAVIPMVTRGFMGVFLRSKWRHCLFERKAGGCTGTAAGKEAPNGRVLGFLGFRG